MLPRTSIAAGTGGFSFNFSFVIVIGLPSITNFFAAIDLTD